MLHYLRSFTTGSLPEAVFDSLTHGITSWWTVHFSGDASQEGGKFQVRFGNTYKTFEVIELIPGEKIAWKCLQAYIDMKTLSKPDEWENTIIEWDILPEVSGSRVTLTHHGLTPELECYEVCVRGWDQFFTQSLYRFLETGTGQPHKNKDIISNQEI